MQAGRYNLLHRIAAGGMAEVWKAKVLGASSFEKTIAIKRLLPTLNSKPDVIRMFIEEAKLAASLTHPNIVQVFDFGQGDDGRYYIAMEYVPGVDLGSLHKEKDLPLEVALFVAIEACKALGHAHSRKIIHRDVSPRNILVSFDGEVKVADFGIAKVFTQLSEHTMPGVLKGKPPYMSPEQVRQLPLDPRSDLFSLGTVLYEMLLGHRLFSGTPSVVFSQILTYEGLPVDTLSSLPTSVADVLERALEPDPDERYQNVLELEAALMEVVAGRGLVEARGALAALARDAAGESDHHGKTILPEPEPPDGEGTIISKKPVPDIEESWHTHTAPVPGPRPRLAPQIPELGPSAQESTLPPVRPRRWPWVAAAGGLAVLAIAVSAPWWSSRWDRSSQIDTPTEVTAEAATPTEVAMPTPPRTRVVTQPSRRRTPAPTPTVHVAKKPGRLQITSNTWVRVEVDGEVMADETPARFTLPPGSHRFVFSNPAWSFRAERNVDVRADTDVRIYVDTKRATITVE